MGEPKKAPATLQSHKGNLRTFDTSLVKLVGLDGAVLLQQLVHVLTTSKNVRNGTRWAYNSHREWCEEHFPWWSPDTIGRLFKRLQAAGLVWVGNYNRHRYDRKRWYAVNFAAVADTGCVTVNKPDWHNPNEMLSNPQTCAHLPQIAECIPQKKDVHSAKARHHIPQIAVTIPLQSIPQYTFTSSSGQRVDNSKTSAQPATTSVEECEGATAPTPPGDLLGIGEGEGDNGTTDAVGRVELGQGQSLQDQGIQPGGSLAMGTGGGDAQPQGAGLPDEQRTSLQHPPGRATVDSIELDLTGEPRAPMELAGLTRTQEIGLEHVGKIAPSLLRALGVAA